MAVSDRSPVAGGQSSDGGFALLLVLWTMVLLAMLGAQVTGAGRSETKLAAALRTGAQLQAAADGALYDTIFHMMDGGGDFWPPGSMTRVLNEPGGAVEVTVKDQRGKLDLNQAPTALLKSMLEVLGVSAETAGRISDGIADWRSQQPAGTDMDSSLAASYRADGRAWGPAGQEFQRIDELQLVIGMTPALYAAFVPYVTLALEQAPWPELTSAPVRAAIMRTKRESGLAVDRADVRGPIVLEIEARAVGPNGAAFTRRVLFRLDGVLSGPAWKYRILAWGDGPE